MLKNSKHLLLHHLRSLVQFTMQRYCFILNNKDWEIKNVGMILQMPQDASVSYVTERSIVQPLWGLTAEGIVPSARGAMLSDSQSYAFGLSEQCFQTLKAMLSDAQSIAFRTPEHCFWNVGAMLLTVRSTSLDHKEQYSRCYGACFYIHTEHCSR